MNYTCIVSTDYFELVRQTLLGRIKHLFQEIQHVKHKHTEEEWRNKQACAPFGVLLQCRCVYLSPIFRKSMEAFAQQCV